MFSSASVFSRLPKVGFYRLRIMLAACLIVAAGSWSASVLLGPDLDPPEWRNPGQSNANPEQGSSVQLYAEGRDDTALRYSRLETDETGAWETHAGYGSLRDMGDVADAWTLSGFTWEKLLIPVGTTVSWRIRYEDASGNETVTDVMSFTIENRLAESNPPQYIDPSVDSTEAGMPTTFSLRWTDDVGLDGFVFSIDNGTGSFVDYPFTEFTEGASGGNWWNSEWDYQLEITVDNTGNLEALTDHAVLITLDTAGLIAAGKMNAHGGDIRFIDGGEELDYWVESGMNTAATRIWVEVPSVAASATHLFSLYYGNPNRTVSHSSGLKTFPFFDDFGGRGWEEFKHVSNPVMGPGSTAGGSGTFSSVLRESETDWRMYASYDSDGNDIGLSTSTDGIDWTHQGAVLRKGSSGEWDSSNIWCPAVWKEGGTYYMLHPATGPVGMQMGLATSVDGIAWTKYDDPATTVAPFAESDPVFNDPDWASGDTEGPCFSVLEENGTYYVMYNTLGGHRQSSIVSSTDLINWTRVYDYPRFPGGPLTSSWNYNTFCGNVFKYEDMFYLVLPGQDSSRDYAKFGIYASHSPEFPEDDTEFKGIVMSGGATGWDAGDMDTPWSVLFDDKMHLYYAACGSCWSQTGLAIMDDLSLALTQAYPPGNYIGLDRSATASLQIMPPVDWEKSISGYLEVNSQNFLVTLDPAISGRAIVQYDGNATSHLELYRDIDSLDRGVISAWMRADNTTSGDYDLYLYGDSQSTLALVVGLGGNGEFHYWNGSFVDTGVSYAADTWYLIQVEFDTTTDTYDFVVQDTSFTELARVNGIAFGGAVATGIDRTMFRTSGAFDGNAHLDDVMVKHLAAAQPLVTVGSESAQIYTDAWARVTVVIHSTLGSTIRWKYAANDTSDNWTTSEIYSFTTTVVDTPPTLVLNSPEDEFWADTASIDFRATCSDELDVAQVSLYGDWGGSWALIDTVSGPGINGVELLFAETLPDGTWTWGVECTDDSANTTTSEVRAINVDSDPDPWWHCDYNYRQRLVVHENSGHALTDYPVFGVLDTAALITAGKLQPDCDDLRVVHGVVEIPSQVMDCDTASTRIWLQTDLPAGGVVPDHYLYYGNALETAPDYSSQSSLSWDGSAMATGKLTATFDADGGIIGQVRDNTNNQDLMALDIQRGLGYLFSENPAVYYIFRVDESDDSIALTVDGPIVKVVTAYSGESPQWVQENIFYNNQSMIDFRVYRPGGLTERFLTGSSVITPDGVFSTAETDELLRVDVSATDVNVTFDDGWRFDPTPNRGYVGIVDPSFTNELALIWDEAHTSDFTWKPRTSPGGQAGTYSLFIGGDGTAGTYGTIDTDLFGYRFALQHSASPDNANTQAIYEYYLTDPPSVNFGPEETSSGGPDVTPPTVTITSPTNITYQADSVPLTFSLSEAAQWCGYSLDGAPTVELVDCAGTVLTSLGNGPHALEVFATDCADNTGSSTVNFIIDVVPFPWWDPDWGYRVPITIDSGSYSRTNEPIEHVKNFTHEWALLGVTGLTFDINSIRVLEYTAAGDLIGEVPSQFDPAPGYDPDTNAVGTIVWIMSGTTAASETRYYYVYWDSTDDPKPAPAYVTDLDWDLGTRLLANTQIEALLGTVLNSGKYRTGINTLRYGGVEYTTAAVSGGAGIYYLASTTAGADSFVSLIDGPVKKTIRLTPAANGELNFTLYDQVEFIRVEGSIAGSAFSFSAFPYAHALNPAVLSNQLHYYNGGAVVDETVGSQGWLAAAPDEGWACLDGLGGNKDLCLVTDSDTLGSSNNFWRYSSSSQQLMLPTWNPNPVFPVDAVSWIVMGDTYQDGRDFWTRLPSLVIHTQGDPESQGCIPTGPDDQCDGLDNDCDGTADDDYLPTPTTCGVGECDGNTGQLECQGGALEDTCDPLAGALPDDQCDGLDNDCDGTADDEYLPTPTTCGVGECDGNTGQLECQGGALEDTCDPLAGALLDDQCDGLDNDCDGTADDEYVPTPTTCGVGECDGNTGQLECQGGALEDTCDPLAGALPDDQCDGLDNDCDGTADDEYLPTPTTCGVGECDGNTGQLECQGGALEDTCDPLAGALPDDQCDGLDNDCDGTADDEYLPTPTTCGVGECDGNTGQLECQGGALEDTCDPLLGALPDDQCDGLDNDCDGTADDEYLPTPTTCGVGECDGNTGQLECQGGALEDTCDPLAGALPDDQCDGLDNDCDGTADDDYLPTPTTCGVGECDGNTGQLECQGGALEDTCDPLAGALPDDQCDGLDNDCDGTADDDYLPTPTTCGVGECDGNTGQLECQGGALEDTCDPLAGALPDDQCDGLDNDCDGTADDDYLPTPTTCGVGECDGNTGQLECQGGALEDTCDPLAGALPDDQCDGLDNDCDGTADDEYLPTPTTCGVGECDGNTGQLECQGGALEDTCDPLAGALPDDQCDGLDNDCDGTADDEYLPTPTTCGVGECDGNTGQLECQGGALEDTCDPLAGALPDDQCDGLDNDCDGTADDDYLPTPTTCGVGECDGNTGQLECQGGALEDTCDPLAGALPDDQCDGLDNDCDGTADDEYVPTPTSCGVGECDGNTGQLECQGGALEDTCDPLAGALPDDQCDGLDNDCDGTADDEYLPTPTTCGVGECDGNTGQLECQGGALEDTCDPLAGALPDDQCDGLDNDCDGTADDEYVPTPTTCGVGECDGNTGQLECQGGALEDTCDPLAGALPDDQCDGLDNDCDGTADDEYLPTPTTCGVGECDGNTGQLECQGGALEDTCDPLAGALPDDQCDGLDNDCDGTADDDYLPTPTTCGVGECDGNTGQLECQGGALEDTCDPLAGALPDDQCDGLDNDCDGTADDEYVPTPTTCGVGECDGNTGQLECQGGALEDTCDPLAGALPDDQCDGLDNDCDGTADDEYVPTPTTCGVGECDGNTGQLECQGGALEDTCDPLAGALPDDQCDGLDNDCDGTADDEYLPTPTTCGVGECDGNTGQLECQGGALEDTCDPLAGALPDDQCDGLDNDCDGTADDEYLPTPTTCGVGECDGNTGQLECQGGALEDTCDPLAGALPDDQCDGLDNDCDGTADDEYLPTPTTCGVGECDGNTGQLECQGGALEDTCDPLAGALPDDQCDGLDNDCDGTADDEYLPTPTTCGVGECDGNTGQLECQGGALEDTCDPLAGALPDDQCDGLDNDCDGTADDDYLPTPTTCGVGECDGNTGQLECQGGALEDTCDPLAGALPDDQCDGLDNDCDGTADDEYVPTPTSCGVGECDGNTGQLECQGGALEDTCDPLAGALPDDQCDGLDNDCDGTADDEYLPTPTTCGVGECDGNTGQLECQGGALEDTCDPLIGATEEICDGADNDCNGVVDDGPPAGDIGNEVRFGPDPTVMTWEDLLHANVYNVYRGNILAGVPFDYDHVCYESESPDSRTEDNSSPPAGQVFYYLVSALNSCQGEEPLGTDSAGTSRPNDNPCLALSLDSDDDGILDIHDNCPLADNPGQDDQDLDGVGDVCDNCPNTVPADQRDRDEDGMGNICDECTDSDGDGFGDSGFPANTCDEDNCIHEPNPGQEDLDGDGRGDACDSCEADPDNDIDSDGVCGDVDICPVDYDPNQDDLDIDGAGDACDDCTDSDGDGFGDSGFPANTCELDNCPDDDNPGQEDPDEDGVGSVCDTCPDNFDPDQTDSDADGLGDVCDPCPNNPNPGCMPCPPGEDPDGDGACASAEVPVELGSPMDFLANTSDPGLGLTWTEQVFALPVDWQDGIHGAGYDSLNQYSHLINTTVPVGSLSIYTRSTFDVADPGAVLVVLLGADYDDAYVAWLNGTEIFRSPEVSPGDPDWNTLPTAGHEASHGPEPDYGELIDVTGLAALQPADNVLAVGVWNRHSGSTDLILAPQLKLVTSIDNCPEDPNPDQADTDGNGVGDVCEP